MIVISRKPNKTLFVVLLVFVSNWGLSQKCEKGVIQTSYKKFIPKDVCIPKGQFLASIYSMNPPCDFNKDGLNDFVFSTKTSPEKMGDKTNLIFYKMNKDSSFTFVKQLSNIYPIHFDPNIEDPIIQDKNLQKIYDCYQMPKPLNYLGVQNDTIVIQVNLDPQKYERLIYIYKYDEKKIDWFLVNKTYYRGHLERKSDIQNKPSISEFSYCNLSRD